ncbi:hypothetical protein VP01_328g8 [Puccinia sorghi]|uniref:Uncharacterized protein n=1 Tax=Puccinia sorghi TaxID=27349 RepID=A0A0L6UXK6_9BASI|nr:hypothetical protein VP01_328g8 [Puccinia sorghi]
MAHSTSFNNQQPARNNEITRTIRSGLPYSSASTLPPRPLNIMHNSPNQINSKPSRSLITVIPPSSLPPNHPPQLRSANSCSGYGGQPSAFSRGVLIPLYPTLAAQMAAIAREYALPSTGGMMVYMVEASPTVGDLAKQLVGGPKISEAAWHILWSGVFEEEEAEAFERELQERENQLRHCCDEYQQDNAEEALNNSVEDLLGSPLDFPTPPLHNRPSLSTLGRTNLYDPSFPHTASSISSSDDSKLHSTNNTLDKRYLLGHTTGGRFNLANGLQHHGRSQSTCMSNKIHPTSAPPHSSSVEMPPRPSTSLSIQPPFSTGRRVISARHLIHPPPMSDRGSSYSTSSYRPRRIGAGMIVGKIEFDIDSSRSNGRWYEQWINPSRLNARHNPSSTTPVSTDVSRPLLLPNLITQRSQSSTSPGLAAMKSPSSSPALYTSPRSTSGLTSSQSSRQTGNSHSFLAFSDNSPQSSTDLGKSQPLEFLNHNQDRPIEFAYRNSNKLIGGNDPLDSGRFFHPTQVQPLADQGPHYKGQVKPGRAHDKRKLSGRLINNNHLEAISLMEAHVKHQALVDQIDAQLSSPIKLDPVPHHAFSIGNSTTTLPGLSLQVTGRPELTDSRFKRNEDGSGSSCISSPETDPANMTHSSTGSSSNSSVDVSDNNPGYLLPGLHSSKRSSSMAIEANLKELEQALVGLSPRALRGPPSSSRSASNLIPVHKHNLDGSSSPAYLGESVSRSLTNLVDENRGGMSKFFDSLQESFQEIKNRSSHMEAEAPVSAEPVSVGFTEGYSRSDAREGDAPSSPPRSTTTPSSSIPSASSRQNSIKHLQPRSSIFFRKNGPSAMQSSNAVAASPTSADRFVSRAASIVAGKFRSSAASSKRKSTIDRA